MALWSPTRYIHVTDPPIHLCDGDSLIGHRVIGGGARYGRVLFVDFALVQVDGSDVFIAGNHFELI